MDRLGLRPVVRTTRAWTSWALRKKDSRPSARSTSASYLAIQAPLCPTRDGERATAGPGRGPCCPGSTERRGNTREYDEKTVGFAPAPLSLARRGPGAVRGRDRRAAVPSGATSWTW
ncbi:hypothetical protein GCM10027294_44300 [Marinactinospora endophytica]